MTEAIFNTIEQTSYFSKEELDQLGYDNYMMVMEKIINLVIMYEEDNFDDLDSLDELDDLQ